MTPVLFGRLQLRMLLLISVATPITLLFVWLGLAPAWVLIAAVLSGLGVGLVCDCVYQLLQKMRWDGDWPTLFFLPAGLIEYGLLWLVVSNAVKPAHVSLAVFSLHYWSIWLLSLIVMFHVIHIFNPLYRYSGGKVLRLSSVATSVRKQSQTDA